MPWLRVLISAMNEEAALLNGKWPLAPAKWTEASRSHHLGPANSYASINGRGRTAGCRGILVVRLGLLMRGVPLEGAGSAIVCWKLCMVSIVNGAFGSWMTAPWVHEPRLRPRPSATEALVSTLDCQRIYGSMLWFSVLSVILLFLSKVSERLRPPEALSVAVFQFLCALVRDLALRRFGHTWFWSAQLSGSNLPRAAPEKARLSTCVVSIAIRIRVPLPVSHLLYKLLHGFRILGGAKHSRPLGRIGYLLITGCRVRGYMALAGEEVQEAVPEVGLHRHVPRHPSTPRRRRLAHQELEEGAEEAEGGEEPRCVRLVRTHQPASGSRVLWTTQSTMFQCALKNATMQIDQKPQQSLDHPRLFRVRDYSLRKPRVRWRGIEREQASLRRTTRHTQTRVLQTHMPVQWWRSNQIHMPVQWWRSNHPPPWMPRHVAWSFCVLWKHFVQSQDVEVAATVNNGSQSVIVFGSHHSVFCMSIIMSVSVMSGFLNVGFARSVNSSLASAGSGSIAPRSSSLLVLAWGQRTVS